MTNSQTPSTSLLNGINEIAKDLNEIVRDNTVNLDKDLRSRHQDLTNFVRENPTVSILGAVALGFLLSRLTKKERVIYMERVSKWSF